MCDTVMLLEKYDLYLNPPQWRWEELVTQMNTELPWKIAFEDYNSLLHGYGRDNFKFLVAVDPETGKAISCVYGIHFRRQQGSHEVFTIGMYYTHPNARHIGLGRQLFDEICSSSNGCNLFLNAAPDMAQKYAERSGFKKTAPWKIVSLLLEANQCDLEKLDVDEGVNVMSFESVDFAQVERYDESVAGGIKRGNFLRKWFTQAGAYNKFATDETGQVIGFCNARIVYGNHVALGPFYADNLRVASTLLRSTLVDVPTLRERQKISAYISDANNEGLDMFKRLGNGSLVVNRVIPRLFTKHVIASPGEKVQTT
uniref:N-acetyltransferase domain-containing protein n=1 Tax=Steinernema glaseri TaxID=37863 RepID=A0A1I7XWU7_9BILA